MHFWKEGDLSQAVCEDCRRLVQTRFEVRGFPLEASGVVVPGVLVAVCTECGGIAALPAQSEPRLKEARERRKSQVLETRVPLHLEDMVHALALRFDTAVEMFRPHLLRFYLREVAADPALARRVEKLARSEAARGRARARVSLRLPEGLLEAARAQGRAAGLRTDADLVRGIIVAAAEDVLDGRAPERRARLSGAAQAEGAPRLRTA
ncbi:MAG TPA: hypothetical protein VFQ45_06865 [Longimicrobium sp.]|nr:hypothetical protein [Longimicrobium sp.]